MVRNRYLTNSILLIALLAACPQFAYTQAQQANLPAGRPTDTKSAIEKTWKLLDEVRSKSYPELFRKDLKVGTFGSNSTFFKARFSFSRFLTLRHLKTIIYVNPAVFDGDVSEDALRAIMAHELAHALYYKTGNRLRLLGLLKLTDSDFTAGFERKADLMAISRGYGDGLIEYREWLYMNVPTKNLAVKRRNYFTPEEITILIAAFRKDPSLLGRLSKKVPRNEEELVEAAGSIRPR